MQSPTLNDIAVWSTVMVRRSFSRSMRAGLLLILCPGKEVCALNKPLCNKEQICPSPFGHFPKPLACLQEAKYSLWDVVPSVVSVISLVGGNLHRLVCGIQPDTMITMSCHSVEAFIAPKVDGCGPSSLQCCFVLHTTLGTWTCHSLE